MSEPLVTHIRGRHAASDNLFPVEENGKTKYIPNLYTRIDPNVAEVTSLSAVHGMATLRIEDNKHSDFWLEFNLDIPTLQRLLAEAKDSIALHNLLFPQLEGEKWAEVDLNAIALKHDQENGSNIDPNASQSHWMEKLHKILRVDNSWGGYLEHRDYLLRNQYNKDVGEDHFWHLGIDFNVPLHTNVHLPIDAELVYSEVDPDQNGGWGGKLVFKYSRGYFILGHLDEIRTALRPYKKGDTVGRVADRSANGGWFPHLHVQCMWKLEPTVDGYSHWYREIREDFPNPKVMLEG